MEISVNGITTKTTSEILSELENLLKIEYGSNFKLKTGGLLYTLLYIVAEAEYSLQKNIEYMIKQFNPETAQSIWQDSVNERLGVMRIKKSYTQFTLEVTGKPNCEVKKNSILIRNTADNNEFTNIADFTLNNLGRHSVIFKAVKPGHIDVLQSDIFRIVRAPSSVNGFGNNQITNIIIGQEAESDEKFRARFRNSKAMHSKATARANLSNLAQYLDDISLISIIDKNTDSTKDAYTVEITAKHNTSDTIFANAILETFGCGIKFTGSNVVTVHDIKGEKLQIRYNSATEIPIYVDAKIVINNASNSSTVIEQAKEKLFEYLSKRVYGLGDVIYSTEYTVPLLKNVEGIDAVNAIGIKSSSAQEYTGIIRLNYNEIPKFSLDRITITAEEI